MDLRVKDAPKIESNAKIVRWNDGSYQLAIGKQFFDIQLTTAINSYIFNFPDQKLGLCKMEISKKGQVNPSLDSEK